MAKAFLGQELVIKMENKVGGGAEVYELISETGVNVVATWGYSQGEDAILLIITDDNETAKNKLDSHQVRWEERDVVLTELENKPGAFHKVLKSMADAEINVDYAYATAATRRWSLVVLQTSNNEKAVEVISD
ncbi:MAG: hypothetical protein JW797_10070 [Bradymonadales bacterium]|nr:hypothetical protein [Bradymonadales bacterium]